MGTLESTLKAEIGRLARKEVRRMLGKRVEDIRRLTRKVADLQADLDRLKRERAQELSKKRLAQVIEAPAEEVEKTRLSPRLVKTLRKKLNVSQPELALLVDVSPAAVGFWESGKVRPRPEVRAKLVGLRQLGRRDVQRVLAEKRAAKKQAKAS